MIIVPIGSFLMSSGNKVLNSVLDPNKWNRLFTKKFWFGAIGQRFGIKAGLALPAVMLGTYGLANVAINTLYAPYQIRSRTPMQNMPKGMYAPYTNYPMSFRGMPADTLGANGSLLFSLHNLRKG